MRTTRIFSGSTRLLLAVGVASLSACTTKMGLLQTQNRFVYPNSNVEPLGRVSAEVTKTTFLVPAIFDATAINETIERALQQKGGDVLLDYKLVFEITPIPVIPIVISKMKVIGTAAKMTVGKQELR